MTGSSENSQNSENSRNSPPLASPQGQPARHQEAQWGLFERLADKANANRLLASLLAATLLASTLNTILLSLLVKSLRLDDRGFMGGQLNWDQASQSSTFHLPTRLAKDKSISLKSIEFSDVVEPTNGQQQQPADSLRFEIWPTGREQNTIKAEPSDNVTPPAGVFLSAGLQSERERPAKSNYLAVAGPESVHHQAEDAKAAGTNRLEIGSKLLALNLAIDQTEGNPKTTTATRIKRPEASNRHSLLEFDEQNESITLPLESQLRMEPPTSGSLSLLGLASSPQIVGALGRNLDVRTPEGHLRCAGESLRVVSRSGPVGITSAGELSLLAGETLFINARELYIPSNVRHFNSEPPSSSEQQVASAALKAYNLMLLDGSLLVGS